VLVRAFELPVPTWLPAVDAVFICALELELPKAGWLAVVDVDGLVVQDLLFVCEVGDVDGLVVQDLLLVCEVGDVDGLVVQDALLVWSVDVPPVDGVAGDDGVVGVEHHLVEYEFVVWPTVCEPEADAVVDNGLDAVLADVFDDVSVLDAPPLIVGWTAIEGCTSMVGWKLMIATAVFLIAPAEWNRDRPPC
jgi:hypothetical protein